MEFLLDLQLGCLSQQFFIKHMQAMADGMMIMAWLNMFHNQDALYWENSGASWDLVNLNTLSFACFDFCFLSLVMVSMANSVRGLMIQMFMCVFIAI